MYNHDAKTEEISVVSETDPVVSEEAAHKILQMGPFDIWALGITVVIGGEYFSWNVGLEAGFGSMAIATFCTGSMYLCLILCNAELCSAFPFTGGAYGLGRLTLGMYWGFVVACCEAMEYIFYVAASALTLADMITSITQLSSEYTMMYVTMFYVVALSIHILGGRVFQYANRILAIVSFLILLMYCFGGLAYVNFAKQAPDTTTTGATEKGYFIGGATMFMRHYSLAPWFYVGIESLNLGTVYVQDARRVIPKGSISCMLTLLCTSTLVLFICSSIPPNAPTDGTDVTPISAALTPFSTVFVNIFKISDRFATILTIPATFATAYGFIFAYGRLIVSMARSNLFPTALKATYGKFQTPFISIISGSLFGYALCIAVYFDHHLFEYIFHVSMLCGYTEYIAQFIGYMIFLNEHGTQARLFRSPFGVYGAVYGLIMALVGAISIIAFQTDDSVSFYIFAALFMLFTVYYHGYAKHKQSYSSEEKNVYFKCHVREFNKHKSKAAKHGVTALHIRAELPNFNFSKKILPSLLPHAHDHDQTVEAHLQPVPDPKLPQRQKSTMVKLPSEIFRRFSVSRASSSVSSQVCVEKNDDLIADTRPSYKGSVKVVMSLETEQDEAGQDDVTHFTPEDVTMKREGTSSGVKGKVEEHKSEENVMSPSEGGFVRSKNSLPSRDMTAHDVLEDVNE